MFLNIAFVRYHICDKKSIYLREKYEQQKTFVEDKIVIIPTIITTTTKSISFYYSYQTYEV